MTAKKHNRKKGSTSVHEFCQNQYCDNPGAKVVPVSVEEPSDEKRTLCVTCEEAYTMGIQHGAMVTQASSRSTVAAVHPALQQIHDLLYLDVHGNRGMYNPDKEWDSNTMAAIAEVVVQHIPRPTRKGPRHDKSPAIRKASKGSHSRTWRCPTCGRRVDCSYEDLAVSGTPICTDCDSEMDLQ